MEQQECEGRVGEVEELVGVEIVNAFLRVSVDGRLGLRQGGLTVPTFQGRLTH